MDSKQLIKEHSEINTQIKTEQEDNLLKGVMDVHSENMERIEEVHDQNLADLEAKKDSAPIDFTEKKTYEKFLTTSDLYDNKKIKAVAGKPIVNNPKFVSFHESNEIAERDSAKMIAVKNAVNRYRQNKTTITEVSLLKSVVRACDEYTNGKISFLRLGEAGRRLKEVKEIRRQAWVELERIKVLEKELSREQRIALNKQRVQAIKSNEKYYAPELDHYYREQAESKSYKPELPDVKKVMQILKTNHPFLNNVELEWMAVRNKEYLFVDADGIENEQATKKYVNAAHKARGYAERISELEKIFPHAPKETLLQVAVKEEKRGSKYTDEEIALGHVGAISRADYFVARAKREARQNAKSNIFRRFIGFITNYKFEENEVMKEIILTLDKKADGDLIAPELKALKDQDYENTFI